jgi:ABC-type transporter Mla subunit MlaD
LATEKTLSTLKIHRLTQEQYDREKKAGTLDPDAIYLTPDDSDSIQQEISQHIANINDALTAAQQAIAELQANYAALQADIKSLTDIISYDKANDTVTFS